MKRLSLFCAAILAAMMSFATVSYELNGGVTNDYGWCTPDSMFATFMKESGATGYNTLAYYKQQADPLGAPNICSVLLNPETCFANEAKWGWLRDYIMGVHTAQAADGASTLAAAGSGAAWRYAVGAFFVDGQRASWPKSANFTTCGAGTPAAFMPTWKGAYANPTEVTEATVLNEPYKEGFTFDGWYAAADFSGAKVTSIDATTTGTLYAKWIEYIPTIAEVKALDDNATTKCAGVVTFINGKNVYMQDATGGMLLYMSATPTFTVGQKVVVSGTKTTYGGAPEVKSCTEVSAEAAEMPVAVGFETFAAMKNEPLKYFAQRVSILGVKICAYDSYNNPSFTDGVDTVQGYKMVLDPTAFPVGSKVNVTAIAAYYNKFQLVGDVAGIEKVIVAKVDAFEYPVQGDYTLANKWIISNNEDNFASNKPAGNDMARGMVAKDGKMYFVNRNDGSLTVVDGATGNMLDAIKITGENLFMALDTTDNTYKSAVTLPFNDIKIDQAGNVLIGACLSGNQHMMVYKVDLTTGAATLVLDEAMNSNPDYIVDGKWMGRFDAFNVYGDVNTNAIIMAADANSFYAYKWTIENGVAGAMERINCTPEPTDVSMMVKDGAVVPSGFGTAPQIFPVDENYFYVDGWSTFPTLFDMDGVLAEDFATCPTGVNAIMGEDTLVMNEGHNGLVEFEVNGEYFLLMAARNTVANNGTASAFALYKFADAAKAFSGLTPLWYFPKNGMGSNTNGCRTAVPSVEVNGNKATLYVYTNNNGYGVYEFTSTNDPNCIIKGIDKTYFATGEGWAADNDSHAEFANCKLTVTNVNGHQAQWQAQAFLGLKEALVPGTTYHVSATMKANVDVNGALMKVSDPEGGVGMADGIALVANTEKVVEITGVCPENFSSQIIFDFGYAPAGSVIEVYDFSIEEVTAVENVKVSNTVKTIENGQVVIIRNGVRYNALGTVIE